jgi:hypothetical protein
MITRYGGPLLRRVPLSALTFPSLTPAFPQIIHQIDRPDPMRAGTILRND